MMGWLMPRSPSTAKMGPGCRMRGAGCGTQREGTLGGWVRAQLGSSPSPQGTPPRRLPKTCN